MDTVAAPDITPVDKPIPREKPTADVSTTPTQEVSFPGAEPETAESDDHEEETTEAITQPDEHVQTDQAEGEAETASTKDTPAQAAFVLDPSRLEQGLNWDHCGSPADGRLSLPGMPDEDELVELSADAAELFVRENRALLRGSVLVDRGEQHLEAGEINYDRDSGDVHATGGVLFQQPGLRLLGREAQLNLLSRQGQIDDAYYRLIGLNARGTAHQGRVESPTLTRFQDITYTACPPDSSAWELHADELDIDRAAGTGVARHAKLRVGGVPILYTPYMSFPLDNRRKTGFLIPSFGNSNQRGIEFGAPFYVNLAPNMDATLIPRYMSKRGIMLGGEFRYLTASEQGEFYGEIIPNDRDYTEGDTRGGFAFQQEGHFGPRWSTNVNFNLVSDDTYLEDFGADLNVTSTRNLERRGDVTYRGDNWSLLGRLQGFQTVDRSIAPEDRPYNRLPQLLYVYDRGNLWQGIDVRLEAENVYFDHSDKVHGNRLAIRPSVSLPFRRPYGHLIPKATLNHASYWLDDQGFGRSDSPNLTVPTLSLDGSLVFERFHGWLGDDATQTLEPRLYYLYTPYEEQDDLPVFDSAEYDFTFASLFRENRFTGRDRIGDANQLTLALTSRIINDSDGRELLRGSIGQILYFEDRRVQLQGGGDDDSASAVTGELAARLGSDWSTRASILWDPNRGDDQTRKSSAGVYYHSQERRLFNLTYRLNRADRLDLSGEDTSFEDTDMSFLWPATRNLDLIGRWLYSLRHDQTMEAFAGVQYGRCCWRLRAVVRQHVISTDDDPELSFMLQLELASLGSFGNDIEDFLQRGVYGYEVE